ncbi:hypothetical protein CR513_55848, partial [Mucuna pruriens]
MIKKKSPSEAYAIIEDMASNTNNYSLNDRHHRGNLGRISQGHVILAESSVGGRTPTSLREDLHICNMRTRDKGKKKGGQTCKIQ